MSEDNTGGDDDPAGGTAVPPAPSQPPSTGRARRTTAKRVDYAKEQDFSDEDLFEDSEKEESSRVAPVAPTPAAATASSRKSKGGGRPRKKKTKPPSSSGGGGSGGGVGGGGGAFEHAYSGMSGSGAAAAMDLDDYGDDVTTRHTIYTEKGYDPSLPPLRERFPFLPEYEEDGSPKIELIVGRRAVDDKEDADNNNASDDDDSDNDNASPVRRRSRAVKTKNNHAAVGDAAPTEYEYLVKYKGRSYLHLEWKTGADLESMNKSAKGIYRRYLKKIAAGDSEDLENPEFEPSFVVPEKILDEADQEITVELTDKELLRWEKQREKELAANEVEGDDDEEDGDDGAVATKPSSGVDVTEAPSAGQPLENGGPPTESMHPDKQDPQSTADAEDWTEDVIDYTKLSIDRLRAIANRDGSFYPVVEGSDNPYRDGYIKEPPKKPRASYLFFQCCMRSYFQKRNPKLVQSEIMALLGDTWRNLTDQDKEVFMQLAKEESELFEKEKVLMERAHRPSEVWQPLRRCKMVLERLATDSFAGIFLEPVDPEDFPDYEEMIDNPMDLGTIRTKLETKKYQAPEQFARDMRRVWNNCKIYNQHGSAIWYVADYMSKLFERLYHAWVLEYRERYLRWADPRARPWEHSCRKHDGKCNTSDEQMVLCDHCDAMYGFKCVTPPLKKAPRKAWHCPDCKPKLKSVKGMRMLSAVAEHAARKRAELGDLPKKTMKQTMYLVKWAGLGFEFCTWETRQDINDDELIAQFHRLNDAYPDEADMTEEVLDKLFASTAHLNPSIAGGISCIPSLRSQLYAQTRAFQFAKCGMLVPDLVSSECGPCSKATSECALERRDSSKPRPIREVTECVVDLLLRVERRLPIPAILCKSLLPPPLVGEYDVVLPITAKGLMLNVGEVQGAVAFLGYRTFPDGGKGPAELYNLIRNVGDKIIAVDGVSTIGKSFKQVIGMLRESGKNKFAYMRFLENRYSSCDGSLSSAGTIGRYSLEELQKKFTSDRQRMVVHRRQKLVETDKIDEGVESQSPVKKEDSDEDSEDGSAGEFQPDSDDEDEEAGEAGALHPDSQERPPNTPGPATEETSEVQPRVEAQNADPDPAVGGDNSAAADDGGGGTGETCGTLLRQETTRSLAFRLLDTDLGYSSDEGGDDDCAYFMDGVDATFTRMEDLSSFAPTQKPKGGSEKGASDHDKVRTIPARQNEFAALGERSKLAAAVALTLKPPNADDFENFPFPPSKLVEAATKPKESQLSASPQKSKRSTVKVEQVSIATGDVLHVWANVEAAAATLQLPLNQLRQVLKEEYDEELGDEVGGYKWRYALAGAKVTAGTGTEGRGGGGKKAKEAWLEFRDKLYDPAEPHVYKNSNRLRDYQVDGVNWLASTWYKRQGCILADEMGLGKTVQIVCFIEHLFRVEKLRRPYLVVVPLSTIEHWRREFDGWTDLQCCVYHDRQRIWRDVLREYEWYYKDRPHTPDFLKFDVLVTTYDTLIGDFDVISQIPFRVAVVDEAHRLRNQKGKLLECMREISARGTMHYGYQSRVLMSGTPLQNDLTELWTLLNFIEPFRFPDLDDFLVKFGNMANKEQVESLQRMISPYMLRRVKDDVAKDIPAKEETVIDVELTSIQKQYYRAIFEHNHAFLNIGATRQTAPKLMNIQMELRKVCNHPYLLEGVEHRETDRQYKEFQENGKLEGKTPEEQQHLLNEHGYVMTSGKMVLLDKLLPKLRQEGHKVLIFSQVKMLDLISEYCEFRSYPYERLDGRIRGTERQKAIDRFEREPTSFVFLLSTRAGGVGINLTAADICILFDSDWNPQNDVQAQARCHRIGQTKDVRIYRLVTSRSFEQEMFDRASRKLGLEQAVLGTFEKDKEDDKPSHEEMEQLLKKGAYALLEDDNDQVTQQFCADDIESILAKRTRTRVVEGAKTSTWLNKQGMVVSKSRFTAEEGDQLDMDDPLFWQKVMPDFVTASILLQKLNELIDEIEGTKKGPGRGRWRLKRKLEEEAKAKALTDAEKDASKQDEFKKNASEGAVEPDEATEEKKELTDEEVDVEHAEPMEEEVEGDAKAHISNETLEALSDAEMEESAEATPKAPLPRVYVRKVAKFMVDVKSLMQAVLEEDDDDALPKDEQTQCQKLLLTVSVKEKIFNEEQRHLARSYLKRLEGDRKRRCRTSEQPRFTPGVHDDEPVSALPEELMIRGKKRRKKQKRRVDLEDDVEPELDLDDTPQKPKPKRTGGGRGAYLGEDGYLHHSDSEADWSDVGEDLYATGIKKRERISRKEAQRRRTWASEDDSATAAGRPWPVFPRPYVQKVLTTVMDEVIKYDNEHGGIFSVPVPRDDFPEYYEQIKNPMDYSTMKTKLENGEYRSALAMQKDFVLILQNCREFNAASSDIVREARRQHLRRPKILKEAALKHDLFLAEDGTVLEIFDEEKKGASKKRKADQLDDRDAVADGPKPKKKKSKSKGEKKGESAAPDPEATDVEEEVAVEEEKKASQKKSNAKKATKKKKPSGGDKSDVGKEKTSAPNVDDDADDSPTAKPRIKIKVGASEEPARSTKSSSSKKSKKKSSSSKRPPPDGAPDHGDEDPGADGDVEMEAEVVTPPPKKKSKKKAVPASSANTEPSSKSESKGVKKVEAKVDAPSVATSGDGGGSSRQRRSASKSKSKSQAAKDQAEAAAAASVPDSVYLDLTAWRVERELLNGSFDAARGLFTKYGPWKLPKVVEDAFPEIALSTLAKMNSKDRYKVFAAAVTESDAPDYASIVSNPMDFGRMKEKVEEGLYGTKGSMAAAALYRDFLLVFDNCRLYNTDDSEVTEEAARILALLPEAYVSSCMAAQKKVK